MKFFLTIFFFILIISEGYGCNFSFGKGLWPFYFKDNSSVSVLSPFFQQSKSKFIFRPLTVSEKRGNNYRFYFLYPIVDFSRNGDNVTKRIFPLFNKKYNRNKITEEKFTSFLLAFWGKSKKYGSYGGIFPLYGKLTDSFNYDEINFYLWPLYFNKRKEKDIDYNLLWPFFGFSSGENYKGFKIWPLFGYNEKKDYRKTKFFLWPIFIFRDKKIALNEWEHERLFFPIYIHSYSKNYDYKTFLYPFFRYNKRGKNYKYYGFPWPFLTYSKFDDIHYEFDFFPLFKTVNKKKLKEFSLFWIVFKHKKIFFPTNNRLYEESISFFLINRFQTNYKEKIKYKNIWPFFEYWEEKNNYIFKLFEPFPFKIPGVYELYSTFFNIFTIIKKKDYKKINFFWGLISYETNKKTKCFTFLKLFKFYSNRKEKINNKFDKLTWELTCNIGT